MTETPRPPVKCLRCGLIIELNEPCVGGLCYLCDDELDDDERAHRNDYCIDCGGEGWIVTCFDDLCHGAGYCIHGDGIAMCHCNEGDKFPSNAPANWRAPKPLIVRKKR